MTASCILVDDEPLAREVLEKYIADYPSIELICSCSSAFEAIEILKKQKIDLIFLDINMPRLSGISMIRSLDNAPEIIFTTAYPEYAVEGFELDAVDYLVKPFSFERFLKGVNKALSRMRMKDAGQNGIENTETVRFLLIKSDGKLYKIDYLTIKYLEAYGDYVRVHTSEVTLTTHDTLKNLESHLPDGHFLRIHRSYIIALDRIRYIEGNRIRIGEEDIPVAAGYREKLIKELDRRSNNPDH